MRRRIEFTVHGQAQPAGSKTPGVTSTGRRYVRDANPAASDWKRQVADRAGEAMDFADISGMLEGPLLAIFEFYRTRPKSHFGTGRNATKLKPSAPSHPTGAPDTLKLARAVEDAMQDVVYRNDAQIVSERIEKHYGERAHVRIVVEEIDP